MARYSIEDTVLTDIADSLREKTGGDTRTELGETMIPVVRVSKTSNALGFDSFNGGYGNNKSITDTVTIEGAATLEVILAYQSESGSYDYVQVYTGSSASGTKHGGKTLTQKTLTFTGDTVKFYFKSDSSTDSYLGYYAEVRGFDADGNPIKELGIGPVEVPNVYKPIEMADAISNLRVGINASDYNCYLYLGDVNSSSTLEKPQWTSWKTFTMDEVYNLTSQSVSSAGANTAIGANYVSSGFTKLNVIPSVDKIKAIIFTEKYQYYVWFAGMPSTKISETEVAIDFVSIYFNNSYSKTIMYDNIVKFGLDLRKNLVYHSQGTSMSPMLMIVYED